jgi:hypothetical protein
MLRCFARKSTCCGYEQLEWVCGFVRFFFCVPLLAPGGRVQLLPMRALFQQLSHCNIIKLLDVYEDPAEVHMVRDCVTSSGAHVSAGVSMSSAAKAWHAPPQQLRRTAGASHPLDRHDAAALTAVAASPDDDDDDDGDDDNGDTCRCSSRALVGSCSTQSPTSSFDTRSTRRHASCAVYCWR